jgi:hypothetical protein
MTGRSLHHFVVYIPDENCYGVTESMGAHVSTVSYTKNGMSYEVMVLNEDLIFVDDISIGIEEEEI